MAPSSAGFGPSKERPIMPRMTGAECLADMLAGYGVTHVFMVPAVLRRTFAEMERRTSIKRIHVHGETFAEIRVEVEAEASVA